MTTTATTRRRFMAGAGAAGLGLVASRAIAQSQERAPNAARAIGAPVGLQFESLDPGLTVVSGAGGNIAVHVRDECVLVIDCGLPDRAAAVVQAVGQLAPDALRQQRLLVNTHYHFDHVGANLPMAQAGYALIASARCRARNSETIVFEPLGMTLEALPPAARQTIVFGDEGLQLAVPGRVRLVKMPPSHTDGDAVVIFEEHGVLHTGDLFFNGAFPVIDPVVGGSLAGMIRATGLLIEMADRRMRVIPGHGPMATAADLRRTLAMLEQVRDRLAPFADRNASLDEVLAAKPLADLDDTWGRGFLRSDVFTRMAYARP